MVRFGNIRNDGFKNLRNGTCELPDLAQFLEDQIK